MYKKHFPSSWVGKESACNAGNLGSIPESVSSPREGIGYPLQYSSAYLVAQMLKNPPAMLETWVQPLDWEDLQEESLTTHSSILAWRIPMDSGAWQVPGVTKNGTWQSNWAHSTAWIKRLATPKLEQVLFCHCTRRNAAYLMSWTKYMCFSKMHMMKSYLHRDIWRCEAFGGIRFREHY